MGIPPYWFSPPQDKIPAALVPAALAALGVQPSAEDLVGEASDAVETEKTTENQEKDEDPAAAVMKRGRPQSESCQLTLFGTPAGPPQRFLPPLAGAINTDGEQKQDTKLHNEPGQFEALI